MQVLKIQSVGDVQEASNLRKFRKLTLSSVKFFGNAKITTNQKPLTRLVWDDFKDESGKVFKGDQLFKDLNSGEQQAGGYVEGETYTFNTTPYQIGDNQATTFSCVVFSNENPLKVANNHLKQNKACVIDNDGVLTAEENTKNNNVTA